jgi:hypothetical protein
MTTKHAFISKVRALLDEIGNFIPDTIGDDPVPKRESIIKDGAKYELRRCGLIYTTYYVYMVVGVETAERTDNNVYSQFCSVTKLGKELCFRDYSKTRYRQTTCKLCKDCMFNNHNKHFNLKNHNKTKKHNNARRICSVIIMDTTKLNFDICNLIMSYL